MPVRALKAVSTAQNGIGAFILQCKRIDFHYCDWGGSSKGIKSLLKSTMLADFARAHPSIQIHISPRPNHHPVVRGSYINGREKVICVRNLEEGQIMKKVDLLRDASGEKLKKVTGGKVIKSLNESIRGIWDPYHGGNKEIIAQRLELDGRSNFQG